MRNGIHSVKAYIKPVNLGTLLRGLVKGEYLVIILG